LVSASHKQFHPPQYHPELSNSKRNNVLVKI
jgi:hypothetical protein